LIGIDVVLKTGLTPSASGSAYFELEPSTQPISGVKSLRNNSSGLKLTCTVHGPRPLPRSATFSSHLLLSTHVKFAPFAARERKGYIRDSSERDLGAHLETALRGILIGERWPKSGLEVIITVLEGEEDRLEDDGRGITRSDDGHANGWGLMSILSGCITVASAAIADAGIDCIDLVTGGVAAIVRQPNQIPLQHPQDSNFKSDGASTSTSIIVDPDPAEHQEMVAACVVGYLQSRDELTEIWVKGNISRPSNTRSSEHSGLELLIDQAIEAASSARRVLTEAIIESTEFKIRRSKANAQGLIETKMQQKAV
jgi:exosome complex component MTR3